METESRDDPLDEFAIAMPADEDMRLLPAISQRHHQLAAMPEGDDDREILASPLLYIFMSDGFHPEHSTENPNKEGPQGRKDDKFQAIHHRKALTAAR